MFTEKCFIRKYSQELVNKLVEIGHNVIKFSEPRYIVCDKNNVYLTSILPDKDIDEYICCDTNEELFLALSAIRDDDDYMQWFVSQVEKDSPKVFIKSTTNSCTQSLGYTHRWDWRCSKATVEELIEYFK